MADSPRTVVAATAAGAGTIAQFVIGKAARDAMFLSVFTVKELPIAMIAGAFVSAGAVVAQTALVRKRGPLAVVPLLFACHACLAIAEWAGSFAFARIVAVLVYIHTASLGATIVSAFWSVVSEAFDPHTAKQVVGRIGAGATLGGVLGGGIAWLASRVVPVPSMLLVVAGLSLMTAWCIRLVAAGATPTVEARQEDAPALGGLRGTPYLRLLALMVLASAVVQSLVEFALGTEATRTYGSGASLLSFFALFQTAVGVLSFLVQLAVNRIALDKLGVGATLSILPCGVLVVGAIALGVPSLLTFAIQRGAEGVLRASLFRSAYEVLFSPVPVAAKRSAKTTIDVGFDRVGMVIGSLLTLTILAWSPGDPVRLVIVMTIGTAIAQLAIAYRLQRGYVTTLAERLRSGVLVLSGTDVVDATTRHTLSVTTQGLDRDAILAQIEGLRSARDERLQLLTDLRAPSDAVVLRALEQDPEHLAPFVFELLELLGRDAYVKPAGRALRHLGPRFVGTIIDAVLDEERSLVVRRRAARLLGTVTTQRAADALCLALDVSDLGVRYASGRALVVIREGKTAIHFDADTIRARARRELALRDTSTDPRHLEHVFNVLSLVFPHEPLQLAYVAVSGDSPALRGVALEYLSAILPPDDCNALTRSLDEARAPHLPSETALAQLVAQRDVLRQSLVATRLAHDESHA